jgi:hypothetical protein
VVNFPHLATYTRAIRVVADLKTAVGTLPLEIDLVALGVGPNELTLTLTGPTTAKAYLRRQELRLARVIVSRARR